MRNKFKKSNAFLKKALEVIPSASQTFGKSYYQYISNVSPRFIDSAKGSHVWDIDGNEYIDFINGLLTILLGYQYPAVDNAIQKQLRKGSAFSLPSPLEYELAQLLIKHIPSAEMVRFWKNGSDVTTAAIRLARAVTGKEHIAICGYHGWHDWYIGVTPSNIGVPKCIQRMSHKFSYNNIGSLERVLRKNKNKFAAIILEPMSYDEPQNNFLQKVQRLAQTHGALLIFDETITGFRFDIGGAQKIFNVTPDITILGKGMSNGMPLSAVVGKKKYMKHMENVFVSSTSSGETLALAAAIATIKELEKKKVTDHISRLGAHLKQETRTLIDKHGLNNIIEIKGRPCWQRFFISPTDKYSELEIKSYLQQELIERGILWYGQHNMSFSHTKKDVDTLLTAYREIFPILKKLLDTLKLKQHMRGKPIQATFKVR